MSSSAAGPQHGGELQRWIDACEKLTPYENLALIGMLSVRGEMSISIIEVTDPKTPENVSAAETWLRSNFRKLLYFYCAKYTSTHFQLAGLALDKSELVKNLAPVAITTFSLPVGIVVAFLFAAAGLRLDNWCRRYGKQTFGGEGDYEGNFPKRKVSGYFDVEYTPAITEAVENPAAYPVRALTLRIIVPEEVKGRVKVPTPEDSISVFTSFKEKHTHRFIFADVQQRNMVGGLIESVFQDQGAGPSVLGFTSTTLELSPQTLNRELPKREPVESRELPKRKPVKAKGKHGRYKNNSNVSYQEDFQCYKWLRDYTLDVKRRRREASFEEEYYDDENDSFEQTLYWRMRPSQKHRDTA